MLSPHELAKDDLKRAFDYLKNKGTEAVKIVSNPAFEDILFEAGVGIPIDFNETEIGVKFVGLNGETVDIRVCSDDLLHDFKEAVCGREDKLDGHVIRVWRWEHGPLCLKQIYGSGGKKEWIVLVPPMLLSTSLNWLGKIVSKNSEECFILQ